MKLKREPLFVQVADILRSEIMALDAGSKLETDQGLSRRFSISVSVVREALSVLSREGLITRKVGRGTFVAGRAPGLIKPIAILCDVDLNRVLHPHYLIQRIQVAKRLLESRGYEVAIYLGDHVPTKEPPLALTCRQFLKDLVARRLGGVLSVWAMPHHEWASLVREQGIPHVGFGLLHENMVSYDFATYLRYALRVLKARGRRKVAYINGVGEWNIDGHDQERRRQVAAIFQEEGMEARDAWIVQEWHRTDPGAGWSSFREIWTRYSDRPDAVVLGTSFIWKEVKNSAQSLNVRIPDDLDIVLPKNRAVPSMIADDTVIPIYFASAPMIAEAVDLLATLLSKNTPEIPRRFVDVWERPVLSPDLEFSPNFNVSPL